jgi:hypothetical protein
MVHALREGWRVLRDNGTLIDLRPLSIVSSIDAITRSGVLQVGECDGTATAGDDRAAQQAVLTQVGGGWLVPRHEGQFEVHVYWDHTDDMAEYVRTGRAVKPVRPSYGEIESARQAAAEHAGAPARLRATRPMTIASYTKGKRLLRAQEI